jgi:hypothetical protein
LEKQFSFGNRGALHIKILAPFSIFKGWAAHMSVSNPMTYRLRNSDHKYIYMCVDGAYSIMRSQHFLSFMLLKPCIFLELIYDI